MIAVAIAAATSDHRAWEECKKLDDEIDSAITDIDALVTSHFPGISPRIYSYSLEDPEFNDDAIRYRGGVFTGPRKIDRHVFIENDVDVRITIRSDWYLVAGEPYIAVSSDDSKGSKWFVDFLDTQLVKSGAKARVGQ